MADEKARGEDEILAAELPTTIAGAERRVRVLSIREAREWKRKLLGAMAGRTGLSSMALDNLVDGGAVANTIGDRMLELVLAYDVDAALGGREYLETKATDAEVYAAFRAMLRVSFPFANDLRTAIAELRALGLADLLAVAASSDRGESGSERSMPEPSASGDSLLVASTPS